MDFIVMHRKKSSEHFDTTDVDTKGDNFLVLRAFFGRKWPKISENAIFQEGLEAYQTGLNYKKNRHKNCPAFFVYLSVTRGNRYYGTMSESHG